jgi:hypothetical protein
LPLALALGIASIPAGTSTPYPAPALGLFTAIIAGFLISALGGSRVQIGGPTTAFVPVVLLIIESKVTGCWDRSQLDAFGDCVGLCRMGWQRADLCHVSSVIHGRVANGRMARIDATQSDANQRRGCPHRDFCADRYFRLSGCRRTRHGPRRDPLHQASFGESF